MYAVSTEKHVIKYLIFNLNNNSGVCIGQTYHRYDLNSPIIVINHKRQVYMAVSSVSLNTGHRDKK